MEHAENTRIFSVLCCCKSQIFTGKCMNSAILWDFLRNTTKNLSQKIPLLWIWSRGTEISAIICGSFVNRDAAENRHTVLFFKGN